MFKVIVAGSRDFNDFQLLCEKCDFYLSQVTEPIVIISGTAKGADKLGEKYAQLRQYQCELFPADWQTHGKRAGYLRNQKMADNADALIAFWDGQSRGTKHMIDIAKDKGLKVRIVGYAT